MLSLILQASPGMELCYFNNNRRNYIDNPRIACNCFNEITRIA